MIDSVHFRNSVDMVKVYIGIFHQTLRMLLMSERITWAKIHVDMKTT